MNLKLIIIAIIILVVVFGAWYLYLGPGSQMQQTSQTEEEVNDSTSSIMIDLNQTPDDVAAEGEFNALDQSLQGF